MRSAPQRSTIRCVPAKRSPFRSMKKSLRPSQAARVVMSCSSVLEALGLSSKSIPSWKRARVRAIGSSNTTSRLTQQRTEERVVLNLVRRCKVNLAFCRENQGESGVKAVAERAACPARRGSLAWPRGIAYHKSVRRGVAAPFTCGESGPRINRLGRTRSEEHTSELQSLMRISYAVFCLTKKNNQATSIQHHLYT